MPFITHARCCECGRSKPLAQLNGYDPVRGDYSQAYCRRLAECGSASARASMDWLTRELGDDEPEAATVSAAVNAFIGFHHDERTGERFACFRTVLE